MFFISSSRSTISDIYNKSAHGCTLTHFNELTRHLYFALCIKLKLKAYKIFPQSVEIYAIMIIAAVSY